MSGIKPELIKIEFDFKKFRRLFEEDPEAAEASKEKLLEATIQNSLSRTNPIEERVIRATEWDIKVARVKSKNPTGSMVNAFQIMWRRVGQPGGFWDAVNMHAEELGFKLHKLEAQEAHLAEILRSNDRTGDEEDYSEEVQRPKVIQFRRRE